MEPDDLPDAEDLWWSWVVLAALHRAAGNDACRFDAEQLVLSLDSPDGSWLRMRRPTARGPCSGAGRPSRPTHHPDARRGAPDWALTDATEERRPTFLAWHAHGEWDISTTGTDEGALHLLRPLLTVDPRIVELAAHGTLTPEELASYANGDQLEEAAELVAPAAADAPPASPRLGAVPAARPDPRPDARSLGDRPDADAAPADPGAVVAGQRSRRARSSTP